MKAPIDLIGPAYTDDTLPVSARQAINWIPEIIETEGARAKMVYKDAPGHEQWETADGTGLTQGVRGFLPTEVRVGSTLVNRYQNRLYAVIGSKLAVFGEDYGFIEYAAGVPIQGVGAVQMAFNGSSVAISALGTFPKLYAYNLIPAAATYAVLDLVDLTFTAQASGTAGNAVSVEYVVSDEPEAVLAVDVADTDITITLANFGDDRGDYDASTNLFPATGGSGGGGDIVKNDTWTISVAGTLSGSAVQIGDTLRALQNAPGQIGSNWIVNGVEPLSTADEIKTLFDATPTAVALAYVEVTGLANEVQGAVDQRNLAGGVEELFKAIYDITTTLAFAPGGVAFCSGYYAVPEYGGARWQISGLNDYEFAGLDVATAESATDSLIRIFEHQGDLWLMGTKTIEQWRNTGAASFPFQRSQGATLDLGLGARFAVTKADNAVAWLSPDGVFYLGAKRISTLAIEHDIVSGDFSEAVAFAYRDRGHWYLVLHLDGSISRQQRKTWCFDISTGLWHRRKTKGVENWRILHYAKLGMLDLGASNLLAEDVPIYSLSTDLKTEAGDELVRECVTGYIADGLNPISGYSLELLVNVGNAAQTGTLMQTDPIIEVCYSDDGGRNVSDWRQRSLGKIGEYRTRVRYARLGRFYSRVFHIRVSDPVRAELIAATLNAAAGQTQ